MYDGPVIKFKPFCRNCVQCYISVVLFEYNIRFDNVSTIKFITDFSFINPEISARSTPPQNLANPVHSSTKSCHFCPNIITQKSLYKLCTTW